MPTYSIAEFPAKDQRLFRSLSEGRYTSAFIPIYLRSNKGMHVVLSRQMRSSNKDSAKPSDRRNGGKFDVCSQAK
jgi:hypothetical protein